MDTIRQRMPQPRPMTYRQALRYLYSFVSYEKKTGWSYNDKTLNLERFREFLNRLHNPQFDFQAIHVAGSDGKGSVCAMMSSVLQAMGYKVGVFSSPHLQQVRERIAIDNEWIPARRFAAYTELMKQTALEVPLNAQRYTTFFELITAMAFLYFRDERVDFAVIETGLGGRLDATNVLRPVATIITHISLEHTDLLGSTLVEIANEKLGIVKPGVPAIIGHQDEDLLPHFHLKLRHHQAPVVYVDESYRIRRQSLSHSYRSLEIESPRKTHRFKIPLLGHYQTQNAMTSLTALETLVEQRIIPPPRSSQWKQGFKSVVWPGRFEMMRIPRHPPIVLDVAHTAKGAASLRVSLDEIFPNKARVLVLGFLQGKKIREMVSHLARPSDLVIFTKAPTPRGASLSSIKTEIEGLDNLGDIRFEPSPKKAFETAKFLAQSNRLICVAGSLYLVGRIRSLLQKT